MHPLESHRPQLEMYLEYHFQQLICSSFKMSTTNYKNNATLSTIFGESLG
uniref:Uncharacterized protein n=1 Tax=Rhizophora mucronata TaxID=61149 RepID=A0A2P2NZF4_RHIMU